MATCKAARGRGHHLLLDEPEGEGEQGGERAGGVLTLDPGAAQRVEDDFGAPVSGLAGHRLPARDQGDVGVGQQ
jgi:hypothetical protein